MAETRYETDVINTSYNITTYMTKYSELFEYSRRTLKNQALHVNFYFWVLSDSNVGGST